MDIGSRGSSKLQTNGKWTDGLPWLRVLEEWPEQIVAKPAEVSELESRSVKTGEGCCREKIGSRGQILGENNPLENSVDLSMDEEAHSQLSAKGQEQRTGKNGGN